MSDFQRGVVLPSSDYGGTGAHAFQTVSRGWAAVVRANTSIQGIFTYAKAVSRLPPCHRSPKRFWAARVSLNSGVCPFAPAFARLAVGSFFVVRMTYSPPPESASLSRLGDGYWPKRFIWFEIGLFGLFGLFGLASVYEMRILGRKGAKNRFNRFGTVYGGAGRKPNGLDGSRVRSPHRLPLIAA